MLTIKKDAIKYKNADGQMESAGVLCKVGIVVGGENPLKYASQLAGLFMDANFPEGTELFLEADNKKGIMNNIFYNSTGLKSVTLISPNKDISLNANNAFMNCATLEFIDMSEFSCVLTNNNHTFSACLKLKTIKGKLDFSLATTISNTFINCKELEDIEIKEKSIFVSINFAQSNLLSDKSIQSIIDGLADLTGQASQILTVHKDVKAKLTDAQIAQITSKNWTLA